MALQRAAARNTSRVTIINLKPHSEDASERIDNLRGAISKLFGVEANPEGPLRIASLTPGELSIGTELDLPNSLGDIASQHGFEVTYVKDARNVAVVEEPKNFRA